jgi:hypothetical protein
VALLAHGMRMSPGAPKIVNPGAISFIPLGT